VEAAYNNPAPPAEHFSPAREAFERLIQYLDSSASLAMNHAELETYVVAEGREVERRLMQGHLDLRSAAERPVRAIGADGVERSQRRRSSRGLMSLVGGLQVHRLVYQAVGAPFLCPQDASLNLPDDSFSLGVRRCVAEDAACGSFDEVVKRIGETTGAKIAKRQVEQIARRAATDFDTFYATRPMNDVEDEKDLLLVLTFDGAGVVMRRQDLRPQTRKAAEQKENQPRWPPKRLSKGEKRNRKRMAQVAAVYAIAPFPRVPEDILRDLRPVKDATPTKPRPKPVHKRAWASVETEPVDVIDNAFQEALRRDPDRERRWVVLVDGNETQLELVYRAAVKAKVEITVILDIIHVLEYLWKASYGFHKDGTQEAEEWVNKRLLMLLSGTSPSDVAAGMTRSATLQKLEKRDAVDACAAYLCKYRNLLHYNDALKAGLPIATGVIEGACRYLVRDRMDRTGARWSLHGAEAVLKLRALRTSSDWDAYWQFHCRAEHERNHASRYQGGSVPSPLPSPKSAGHLRRVK
jgi:hypothetical protein